MKISDFLAKFEDQHFPQMVGPWLSFDAHEPPFTAEQLRRMESLGIIEIGPPGLRQYRLTQKAARKASEGAA